MEKHEKSFCTGTVQGMDGHNHAYCSRFHSRPGTSRSRPMKAHDSARGPRDGAALNPYQHIARDSTVPSQGAQLLE